MPAAFPPCLFCLASLKQGRLIPVTADIGTRDFFEVAAVRYLVGGLAVSLVPHPQVVTIKKCLYTLPNVPGGKIPPG
jgi:hypothetical protein